MANIMTGVRIVLSGALLFLPALSPVFFALYAAGGLSDMIDGAVARRTGTVSEFGSKLDTIADIVFVAVCLIKVIPVLVVPIWLYIWIAVIAFIKMANIAAGYARQKEFISVHSVINKVTGGLLFVFYADTDIHRFEVQCRSCLHVCDCSGDPGRIYSTQKACEECGA